MAISEKAKTYTEVIYKRYGSGTGWLFGIDPSCRDAVEGVVQTVLDITEEDRQESLLEMQEATERRSMLDG